METTTAVVKLDMIKERIVERCGSDPVADGIQCTNCGCQETFKSRANPEDTDKWFFMIRAFRVDDSSQCMNCNTWFNL